jgi:hypothetical protein
VETSEFLRILGLVLFPVAAWTAVWLVRWIRVRWLRLTLRIMASGLGVLGAFLLFLLFLSESACTARASYGSPDGRHVAVVACFEGNFSAPGDATVSIRSRWNPLASTVFEGEGECDLRNQKSIISPNVQWLDNQRLSIRYYQPQGEPVVCGRLKSDVDVACQTLP